MYLKILSAKWRSFCLGLHVLNASSTQSSMCSVILGCLTASFQNLILLNLHCGLENANLISHCVNGNKNWMCYLEFMIRCIFVCMRLKHSVSHPMLIHWSIHYGIYTVKSWFWHWRMVWMFHRDIHDMSIHGCHTGAPRTVTLEHPWLWLEHQWPWHWSFHGCHSGFMVVTLEHPWSSHWSIHGCHTGASMIVTLEHPWLLH